MFNYIINWTKVVKENIPYFLHYPKRLNRIYSFIKPLKVINGEFEQVRTDYVYKVGYNAQVIYLEKILNDKYDTINRGIFISDSSSFNKYYLYRKVELKPPIYLYRKWDATVNYVSGEYSVEGNSVYRAIADNTNFLPSANTTSWVYYKEVEFMRRGNEYITTGFVVNIPSSVVFDEIRLKALVNYYKFEGRHYTINIY